MGGSCLCRETAGEMGREQPSICMGSAQGNRLRVGVWLCGAPSCFLKTGIGTVSVAIAELSARGLSDLSALRKIPGRAGWGGESSSLGIAMGNVAARLSTGIHQKGLDCSSGK